MKQFYFFLLKEHKSKAEALRLTKLEFLHSGTALSHPRYWAAFVLNGDGAEPVPSFVRCRTIDSDPGARPFSIAVFCACGASDARIEPVDKLQISEFPGFDSLRLRPA